MHFKIIYIETLRFVQNLKYILGKELHKNFHKLKKDKFFTTQRKDCIISLTLPPSPPTASEP